MTDKPTPKPNPRIHWTVSKGEPPAPPEELQPEGIVPENEEPAAGKATAQQESADNMADENAGESDTGNTLPGIQEEKPRRKSLRERNIIRLLELGDEALQMRDYRMARKYYNEAKTIFNSREAIDRLRDLDRMRRDFLHSLIYDPSKENDNGRKRGEKSGRRDHNGRAERRRQRFADKPFRAGRAMFREGEKTSEHRGEGTGERPARRFSRGSGSRHGFGGRGSGKTFGSRGGRPWGRSGGKPFGKKTSGKKSFGRKPFSGKRSGGPRKG